MKSLIPKGAKSNFQIKIELLTSWHYSAYLLPLECISDPEYKKQKEDEL